MLAFKSQLRTVAAAALASMALGASAAELPPLPAGLTAPAKPAHLPDFNLAKPESGSVRASDFKGKVMIARFWATW